MAAFFWLGLMGRGGTRSGTVFGCVCYTHDMSEKESQSELLLFEVETSDNGQQSVKRVVRECSVTKAARLLGVNRKTVQRLYYAGIITGWKPGLALARKLGRDGKTCKIVLDWDSVVEYREVERMAQRAVNGH